MWQLQAEAPDTPNEPQFIYPLLGEPGPNPGNIDQQSAYWVDAEHHRLGRGRRRRPRPTNCTTRLRAACWPPTPASPAAIAIVLTTGNASQEVKDKFPHLADLPALKIADGDLALVPEILKGQIAVSAVDADGQSVDATGLQIPGVLDDLYTYNGELGVSWEGGAPTIRLWAPTAKSVTFHLFDDSDPGHAPARRRP